MTYEQLYTAAWLTLELTKLQQAECAQLCIENFAPAMLGALLAEMQMAASIYEGVPVQKSSGVVNCNI